MPCLGSVLYDPSTLASVSAASNIAMTAFDTTNARITFTAPTNGIVIAKIRVTSKGGTAAPSYLLGVLENTTVRARQVPIKPARGASTGALQSEVVVPITGLTGGNSYTFDAAYGVETGVASHIIGWGGPNNTTANDAMGALSFEIWDAETILGAINYDPGTAVAKAVTGNVAMTALDTTNLRISFTVPASGQVAVRLRSMCSGGTGTPVVNLGILESATVKFRQVAWLHNNQFGSQASTTFFVIEAMGVVSGLTPSASLTWDAAYGTEAGNTSMNLRYGGPNDTTADNAYGGFTYEIWAV